MTPALESGPELLDFTGSRKDLRQQAELYKTQDNFRNFVGARKSNGGDIKES